MNYIHMSDGDLRSYANGTKNQEIASYLGFADAYYRNGELAFYDFVVKTENTLAGFKAAHFEDIDAYGLQVMVPIEVQEHEGIRQAVCTINMHLHTLDNGASDFYFEVWEGDHQLDDATQKIFSQQAIGLMILFFKVQRNALKCQKRIAKQEQMLKAQKPEPHKGSGAPGHEKTILLCPGIRWTPVSEEEKDPVRRGFLRRCEAWSVRGHYRHLKSGKVAYVRPHTRGSGRVKDTSYAV